MSNIQEELDLLRFLIRQNLRSLDVWCIDMVLSPHLEAPVDPAFSGMYILSNLAARSSWALAPSWWFLEPKNPNSLIFRFLNLSFFKKFESEEDPGEALVSSNSTLFFLEEVLGSASSKVSSANLTTSSSSRSCRGVSCSCCCCCCPTSGMLSSSTSESLRCRSRILRRNSSSSWPSLKRSRRLGGEDEELNRCHHQPTWFTVPPP